MKDTARPRRPPRFPRHRHEWRDLGAGQHLGDWRYRCAVCRRKSRNPFYQRPEFRQMALAGVASDERAVSEGADWRAVGRRVQRRRVR